MIPSTCPPITTSSLTLRNFVPDDAPKDFAMSQESGMRAPVAAAGTQVLPGC
jgi:hypothetical protein